MAKKEVAAPAVTLYVARKRRNEVGIGAVAPGDKVDLSGFEPQQIAAWIANGVYSPDGELPEDVSVALAEHRGG